MSRSSFCFGTENLLRGVGYSSRRYHKIDGRNDDFALRNEDSRTIAAVPDPHIAASCGLWNGNGDVENWNTESIECLHDCPPKRIDTLSRHNLRMSYRNLFLPVVAQSQLRKQRKINDCNVPRRSAHGRSPRLYRVRGNSSRAS